MNPTFRFELGDNVGIIVSSERGMVIARAEYLESEPQYLLRYKAADGRACEAWWAENALTPN